MYTTHTNTHFLAPKPELGEGQDLEVKARPMGDGTTRCLE